MERAESNESSGASGLASAARAERDRESADALLAELAALIERHKSYPRAARRARLQGVVRVRVSIDPTGRLTAYGLQEESGHRVLDRATLKLFKRIVGERVSNRALPRPLEVVVPVRYRHG
ncbi:MAG: energy transducer TonB [Thermodesulfobacteriota bacterium]